jgi:hypothetical protein
LNVLIVVTNLNQIKPQLKLDWCSHEAAKYAVEHWHYSKSMPTPPLVKVGVWEDSQYIGCVLISRGANNNLGVAYGLKTTECCELTRVALSNHKTPVSRIVSIAIRFLLKSSPGLRLVVSYADPNHGHVGSIYQAGNWVFVGQMPETTEYIGPDGKQWHSRMISPTGFKKVYGEYRPVFKPSQCKPIKLAGKYKYLYPLTPEIREKIKPLAKPYPKRAGSVESDTANDQLEEGGANPTPALQIMNSMCE